MALYSKHPHIRVDELIWDDPVTTALSPHAFRTFIFAIAWSKTQQGRTPDGILNAHGVERISARPEDLSELVAAKLFIRREDGTYEIAKYSDWQVTSEEVRARQEVAVEAGKIGAARRWSKMELPEAPPLEDGFDVKQAFNDCFNDWPKQVEKRFTERTTDAFESFRSVVGSAETYDKFSVALQNRIRLWKKDERPVAVKRPFLGAFKNFCQHWQDYTPSQERSEAAPTVAPTSSDLRIPLSTYVD